MSAQHESLVGQQTIVPKLKFGQLVASDLLKFALQIKLGLEHVDLFQIFDLSKVDSIIISLNTPCDFTSVRFVVSLLAYGVTLHTTYQRNQRFRVRLTKRPFHGGRNM